MLDKTTINACFPRSGHRFLRTMCREYFGSAMNFGAVRNNDYSDLGSCNYIKDHDFGLRRGGQGLVPTHSYKYLIQYRHPLESLTSYFEFTVMEQKIEDSLAAWRLFLQENAKYWIAFVTKWCISDDIWTGADMNRCLINYDELYSDTKRSFEKVIKFLSGRDKVDEARIEAAIKASKSNFYRYADEQSSCAGAQLSTRRDIRDFRYFDGQMVAKESELDVYLEQLGIPRIL